MKKYLLLILASAFLGALASNAQIYDWNLDANGNWNTTSNWTPNTGFPNAIGNTANITNNITANRQVNVNAPITVGIVNIGDADGSHQFTLAQTGGNSLTFDNTPSNDAQLNKISGSTTTVSAPLILNDRLLVTNNQVTAQNFVLSGAISGAGGMTFSTDQPLSSAITGTGASSFTASNLQLTANTTYTGSTILAKGDLTINGAAASISGTSELIFRGGNVVVRNISTALDNNRINNSADFRIQSDGAFVYRTDNSAYTASETVRNLILESGTFMYRVMNEAPTGFSASFTFNNLDRSGANNFSFANFGSNNAVLGNATTAGTNRLFFNQLFGSSSTNSTYLGGWATYGSFNNFAAYDTTRGIIAAAQTNVAASSNDAAVNFVRTSGDITLNGGAKSMHTYAHGINNITTSINGTLTLVGGGLTFGGGTTGATPVHNLTNGSLQVGNTVGADTLFVSVGANSTVNATISAVIQNNGADVLTVAKGGPGTLTLNNTMTYTGNTYVEGGSLILGSAGSLENGNVTVRRGAAFTMLSGSQINFNILNISSADVFTQNEGGSFTLAGTMLLDFSTQTHGTWDLFNLSGSSTADGFAAITLGGAFSGSLAESLGVWTGTSGAYSFTFTESTGVLSVIPEPTTWALLAAGLTTMVIFRRRRIS